MGFSSNAYLRGLGWSGPGSSLTNSPNARSKPITVIQKKTLSGIGKDRDEAFPWWEMVFASVANKSKTDGEGDKSDLHRTSTGIISNRAPPVASTSNSSSSINMDVFADAKKEAARRQLYGKFMRGKPVGSSLDLIGNSKIDSAEAEEKVEEAEKKKEKKKDKKEKKDKKGKKRALEEEDEDETSTAPASGAATPHIFAEPVYPLAPSAAARTNGTSTPIPTATVTVDSAIATSKDSKEKEKENRKKKKRKVSEDYKSPEEELAAEEEDYKTMKRAAKEAEREEKRLRKIVKKAMKEEKAKKH